MPAFQVAYWIYVLFYAEDSTKAWHIAPFFWEARNLDLWGCLPENIIRKWKHLKSRQSFL
jgi:hypothetical protein